MNKRDKEHLMYIPKHYLGKGNKEAIAFMKRFNFGTIITSVDNSPIATHLPFVISEKEDELIITSHFAKANDHWKQIEENENLVIFSEPHAYISPKNYERKENVPTWNYISVHAYGRAKILEAQSDLLRVLESMMNTFDPAYKAQWDSLPEEYKLRMSKGIVAFEIRVSKLQSKEKLSQNKTENERKKIIDSLSKSDDMNEKTIAEFMNENELAKSKNKEA